MTFISSLFSILFLLVSWKIVSSQENPNIDELNRLSEKESFDWKDGRLGHSIPDMRVVLNNLLRYENPTRHHTESNPSESDHILNLSSRSKGTVMSSDDPLAVIASGFHGSRGKRPSYDEIPIFANGFPANRGKK